MAGSAGHAEQALPRRNLRGIVRRHCERRMSCGPVDVPSTDGRGCPGFESAGLRKGADITSGYPKSDSCDHHNYDDARDQSRPAATYFRYIVHSKSHQITKRLESAYGQCAMSNAQAVDEGIVTNLPRSFQRESSWYLCCRFQRPSLSVRQSSWASADCRVDRWSCSQRCKEQTCCPP
jgi:hypothetical protein